MKLAKKFGMATVALAISAVAVVDQPTQAALIIHDFTVDATSGGNPGKYFGSFSYDDLNLSGQGSENLGVENGLSILFNYLGNQYTEKDDIDYDFGAPVVSFQDGNLLGLSYLVEDQFFIGNNPNTPETGGNKFYSILSGELSSATQIGTVSYSKGQPVPEPLTISGTLAAGTVGLFLKRQKKATSKVAK